MVVTKTVTSLSRSWRTVVGFSAAPFLITLPMSPKSERPSENWKRCSRLRKLKRVFHNTFCHKRIRGKIQITMMRRAPRRRQATTIKRIKQRSAIILKKKEARHRWKETTVEIFTRTRDQIDRGKDLFIHISCFITDITTLFWIFIWEMAPICLLYLLNSM